MSLSKSQQVFQVFPYLNIFSDTNETIVLPSQSIVFFYQLANHIKYFGTKKTPTLFEKVELQYKIQLKIQTNFLTQHQFIFI
jgi:hypothetical protein